MRARERGDPREPVLHADGGVPARAPGPPAPGRPRPERSPTADGETAALKRTLRDLLGLLALPAGWRGRSPGEILVGLSEALDATVDVDVVVVAASGAEDPADVVRIGKASAPARTLEARGWFASLAATSVSSVARLPCGELGELSVASEPLGHCAALGHVFVASGRPGFPSPAETAVIRAATALATSALETSRALREEPAIERQVEHLGRLADDLLDIGLALVRTLATAHGAAVAAASEGEGSGSPLDRDLPLAPAQATTPEASAAPGKGSPPAPRRRRILVVDDNVDSGVMLAAALEMSGHEVRVLHDPFAVAEAARAFSAEIVILDLGMPDRDGYQVASDIQAHFGAQAPALVALTGYGQASDRAKTTAAGFAAHLLKPVNLGQLLARIASM